MTRDDKGAIVDSKKKTKKTTRKQHFPREAGRYWLHLKIQCLYLLFCVFGDVGLVCCCFPNRQPGTEMQHLHSFTGGSAEMGRISPDLDKEKGEKTKGRGQATKGKGKEGRKKEKLSWGGGGGGHW